MNRNITVKRLCERDRTEIIAMMTEFYSSPAVSTNGSEEIFNRDFEACIGDNPYLEGYGIWDGERLIGYGMTAKGFSTEFGKPCIWVEDIYIIGEYRGKRIGEVFFDYIEKAYPDHVFRLEVSDDNERAIALYKRKGYEPLHYVELIKK